MEHFVIDFDRVAFSVFSLDVRWYALSYVFGFLLGSWWMRFLVHRSEYLLTSEDVYDFMTWAIIGVILGGRLGYVLFYHPLYYAENLLEVLQVWRGGMSFHGGVLGVLVVTLGFCYRRGIKVLVFSDLLVCSIPIGLFLGRVANFVNGELWGRESDVFWAMIFPLAGDFPRHPSQLYEAFLEGIVLFAVLNWLGFRGYFRYSGFLAGLFFVGYGGFRIVVEFFREPDTLELLLPFGSLGQWLSIPMILFGLGLVIYSRVRG